MKMPRNIIDVTGTIEDGMWASRPPIGKIQVEQIASVEGEHGWNASRLTMYTITGTYLESSGLLFADGEIFYTLKEAQILIGMWRKEYNTVRSHRALGYRPPAPETIMVPATQFQLVGLI